jgi:hypothetical protein
MPLTNPDCMDACCRLCVPHADAATQTRGVSDAHIVLIGYRDPRGGQSVAGSYHVTLETHAGGDRCVVLCTTVATAHVLIISGMSIP